MWNYEVEERLLKVTGVILAGGKNTRMGVDKAFLEIDGVKFIDRILSVYKKIFSEIIIITNTPEKYKVTGVKIYRDLICGKGSLGGLYTGILKSQNDYAFITACDMPYPNKDLVEYIASIKEYDAVVPLIKERYHPLFAMYSKKSIEIIESQLKANNLRIQEIFQKLNVRKINENEIMKFDRMMLSLLNINTPQEYRNFLKCEVK
ncbi:molybdenum cofactor guanylyltransferase [Clostridium sp. YIM B02551]|uniref:molybdenum cofactor guanylyltransferase n=1 Tax=Clostridium sp. YIM B02551 TaxID=2910679 RepID=UPI001EEA5902|nr:molybdenum cofactor guanylyltransferase [Clostridium sp. YIM B02551]